MAERVEAVFVNAGSYVMRPKSSSSTFIWRKSIARTVPSVMSISYVLPVRLSVTDSVSLAVATPPALPSPRWVSSLMHLSLRSAHGLPPAPGGDRSAPVPLLAQAASPALRAPRRRGVLGALGHRGAHIGEVLVGFGGGEARRHRALGDVGHLGRVEEAAAVGRVRHDAVEDVRSRSLLDAGALAQLDAVGRAHDRPAPQRLVRDREPVVQDLGGD